MVESLVVLAEGAAVADATASGVRIEYEDLGSGEPALLFLTGWCSSRERWAKVAQIEAQFRRVLSFDWRGHGGSGSADGDFGVEEMVADALAVIDASGADVIVPCAASHSGWVAIELSRRLGDRVPKLVHADWMVTTPHERYMQVIRQLDSDEWVEARDLLFKIWAAGRDAPWLSDALRVMDRHGEEMWRRGGRVIGESYDANRSPLETWSRLVPLVPVIHIYGQPQDMDYLELQEKFSGTHNWYSVRKLDALTHFAMLEQPEHVATAIEEFVS